MSRTAIYLRISYDRTGEAAGVARQEKAARELANAKQLDQPRVYKDNDRSATRGARPEFEKLLQDVEAGRISTVLAWHLDRIMRNFRDLVRLIEAGKPHRLNVACVNGPSMDLGDPTGVAVASIITAIAQMEVEHKANRQRAANRERAESGEAFWVRRPFGYDFDQDGNVHVVEEEASAIRRGAQWIIEGRSVASVCRDWNERGLKTTAGEGGDWSVTSVRRLMKNPRYIGRRTYAETRDGNRAEPVDLGPGNWQPILRPETQQELEQILNNPNRKTSPEDTGVKYLLTGLIRCGKCGKKMYASPAGQKTKRHWMAYKCQGGYCSQRRMDQVDEIVEATVTGFLARPEAARLFSNSEEVSELRTRRATLRARRKDITALHGDGLLDTTEARLQLGKLKQQLDEIDSAIETASSSTPVLEVVGSEDVDTAWLELPVARRRAIISDLLTIELQPGGRGSRFKPEMVQMAWKFPGATT
ncbi:recombinase family protein [Nesterenkonia haasae]|uniref:recombinase family protein n=1 Tax=Nesterenkonia haasae TaxID=2587813 RepID=UPI001390CA3E|nr:recombinase family protein [Nesterenkonia haasae]